MYVNFYFAFSNDVSVKVKGLMFGRQISPNKIKLENNK